jgi:hypothetical protein
LKTAAHLEALRSQFVQVGSFGLPTINFHIKVGTIVGNHENKIRFFPGVARIPRQSEPKQNQTQKQLLKHHLPHPLIIQLHCRLD